LNAVVHTSCVQGLPSAGQVTGAPPLQTPAVHVSVSLHGSPSSQAVPFTTKPSAVSSVQGDAGTPPVGMAWTAKSTAQLFVSRRTGVRAMDWLAATPG
jgi:hypothetical protein